MTQWAIKAWVIVAALGCLTREAAALDFGGGVGAGCGGGIGSSYSGGSFGGGSFGGTGFGGGNLGCSGHGSRGMDYGGWSYSRRSYTGMNPSRSTGRSQAQVPRSASQPATARTISASRGVLLNVTVPPGAKLFINDRLTDDTGTLRRFTSNRLQPDAIYPYRLRVEFVANGDRAIEEKTVHLAVGREVSVTFAIPPEAPPDDVAATASH